MDLDAIKIHFFKKKKVLEEVSVLLKNFCNMHIATLGQRRYCGRHSLPKEGDGNFALAINETTISLNIHTTL